MQLPYNDFGNWMRSQFPFKVQKLSVNAGFTCPTRDGHTGFGGCTYCNNRSFNPSYCEPQQAVSLQLEAGKKFFARKYPNMKYLAYFQAYTSTYDTIDRLKAMYEEALMVEDVVGLVIGTRPDCMPDALLHYLEGLNKHTFLIVEYGVESANNQALNVATPLNVVSKPSNERTSAEYVRVRTSSLAYPVKMRMKAFGRQVSSLTYPSTY